MYQRVDGKGTGADRKREAARQKHQHNHKDGLYRPLASAGFTFTLFGAVAFLSMGEIGTTSAVKVNVRCGWEGYRNYVFFGEGKRLEIM